MTDRIGNSQQQIQFEELDLELMILTLVLSLTRRGGLSHMSGEKSLAWRGTFGVVLLRNDVELGFAV